jgi:multiple antibiotic resistance protein
MTVDIFDVHGHSFFQFAELNECDLCPMFDLTQIGKAFLILFAVIDIVGGIPLILQVRQKAGKIYPARATLVSLAIMVTFLYVGESILKFLGLDVNSFAVAGSFVLFFLALEMILGVRLFREDTSAPGLPTGAEDPKIYSIVPLAFPVIAGAGTITTILSLRAELDRPNILMGILLNMVVVVVVLLLTNRIERLLGRVGLIVLRKAFGIILLAIAVKLFAGNITYLFPR